MDRVPLPQAQDWNYLEEAVYFVALSSQKFLVASHFLSTSEGRTTQMQKSDPKKGVLVLM